MTPEEKRRHYAAERVIYMAVKLSEAHSLVQMRTEALEARLHAAARAGIPRSQAEAMTEDLDDIDVEAMLDRAYEREEHS